METVAPKLLWLLILLFQGQLAEAHNNSEAFLSLEITSREFADGIAPDESGTLNIHITNQGSAPNEGQIFISIGHNVTHDLQVLYQVLMGSTPDPSCQIYWPHIDPRPPVDDIMILHFFTVDAGIGVGETYSCGIDITFTDPGMIETVWFIHNLTPDGWVTQEVPFVFRGQPIAVPLTLTGIMLLVVLIGVFGMISHQRKNCLEFGT
ncbi:hypothetical protein [Marinicella meishanensis]|uniref:hypothetical protein n=1 Tax=Marinicella meishanensis TaxID=2873263 RepID=UPI001CC031EC|nr:hypothetical protein [Marinicella sp. NBU2979]